MNTRREMLKQAGIAAIAGTALAARAVEERPPLRVAMIGNRGHNSYVLKGLPDMPHASVVGLAHGSAEDPVTKLEDWCGKNGHTPKVFDDYRRMLDTVKPDAVTVCGPFELHAQMCIDAFERGLPVFCEKLAATTLEDYERLAKAHTKAGVHFATMMGLRYDPAFYTAWRAVRDGAIGRVRLVQAQKSYVLGNRPDYYRKRETSSGLICWVGSHAVDGIFWFCDQPFERSFAVQSSEGNHGLGDLEMTAQCQFELGGGIVASASLDYLRPASAGSHGDDRIRVAGTEGVIEVRDGKALLVNSAAEGVQTLDAQCNLQIFADFADHVQGRSEAILGPRDVFAVTKACLLARQSADSKRPSIPQPRRKSVTRKTDLRP